MLEQKLNDQAELTTLWARGVDVKFPETGEWLPTYNRPESRYKRRLFVIPCKKCKVPVIRMTQLAFPTCEDCKVKAQVERNKNSR